MFQFSPPPPQAGPSRNRMEIQYNTVRGHMADLDMSATPQQGWGGGPKLSADSLTP